MAAAIVKFDTLADAVRPTTKDEDLALTRGCRLVVAVVGRVHVGGLCLELSRASIDALHGRCHALGHASLSHLTLRDVDSARDLDVAEAAALDLCPVLSVKVREGAEALEPGLRLKQVFHLAKEPGIKCRQLTDLLCGHASHECLMNGVDAIWVGHCECLLQRLRVTHHAAILGIESPSGVAGLDGAECFVEGLLPGAADAHRLADRLHLRGKDRRATRELLESKAGNFGDDVVDAGLKAGRSLAGDVIRNAVKGTSDCELSGHLGNWEARRLGREGRGAAHTRVHLDDHELTIRRIDGHLHVGPAAFDADLADDVNGGVAEALILFVREGLRRRNGDGVTRVYAHGVEVLDRAYDDNVVCQVAHHLKLVLLPTKQGPFNQYLVSRGGGDAGVDDDFILFHVVGNAAAGAAECEGRADDEREAPDLCGNDFRLFPRGRRA
mmetsp:Transcript_27789/g.69668  ORF Transcript_27789/g.69668 Transcript_27789/m.69668 type:complete len:440 (+) Transcript_27789:2089-3408(+)